MDASKKDILDIYVFTFIVIHLIIGILLLSKLGGVFTTVLVTDFFLISVVLFIMFGTITSRFYALYNPTSMCYFTLSTTISKLAIYTFVLLNIYSYFYSTTKIVQMSMFLSYYFIVLFISALFSEYPANNKQSYIWIVHRDIKNKIRRILK